MKYPAMSKQREMSVTVPSLDGGVNYTDMPYEVQDNQLTECKNMWWHKGALRTRPGVRKYSSNIRYNGFHRISETEVVLTELTTDENNKPVFTATVFHGDGTSYILGGKARANFPDDTKEPSSVCVRRHGDTYYAFFDCGIILFILASEKTENGYGWRETTPYAPLVLMNGKGMQNTSGADATNHEAYNLLKNTFRCQYTTDGKSSEFQLPEGCICNDQTELKVSVTLQLKRQGENNDRITETITFFQRGSAEDRKKEVINLIGVIEDGDSDDIPDLLGVKYDDAGHVAVNQIEFKCHIDRKTATAYFDAKTIRYVDNEEKTNYITVPLPALCVNNLEFQITKPDTEDQKNIYSMNQSTWFGGLAGDTYGGTRMFLAGHPKNPSAICWSGIQNPLYIPDNSYLCVGNSADPVTGFGRMADKLIVFKERETYSIRYVDGSTVGGVANASEQAAIFPITPVHSTVGCDCPNTIRLVNNQLVWLCSDGHVYTLPTVNQYEENNVRDISLLIQNTLQRHTKEELKTAVSGEYMGYYFLAVGNNVYMMNAECSAFAGVHYYSSKERAQRAIPWYVWELPETENVMGIVSDGNHLRFLCADGYIEVGGANDLGEPIPCSFTTKAFNFGSLDKRKAINQLYLSATAQSPLKMRLSYITDRFTAEDAAILEGEGDPDNMTAENYKVYRVTPNAHRVGLFGLRVDCDGAMAVNGLTIKYKNEGVTR